jgi:AcrR family transcriptional regulator
MPKISTKEQINPQAARLFVKEDFSASVNDLIAKVGIAKGTFYHYFKSKD